MTTFTSVLSTAYCTARSSRGSAYSFVLIRRRRVYGGRCHTYKEYA